MWIRRVFAPVAVFALVAFVAFVALFASGEPPDRGEKNAQVLREFIEKHCRVVAKGAVFTSNDSTIGQIKCDQ